MRHTTKLAPDTETHPIAPGLAAPPMVCTAWADGKNNGLIHVKYARRFWRRILRDRTLTLVNNTMHFDAAVVCATYPDLVDDVFAKYEAGLMRCNVVDQRLIDISNGCLSRVGGKKTYYSLKAQMKRHFDVDRDKGADTWQLRYNELEPIEDVEQWPIEAQDYPKRDASNALMCSNVHDESADLLRDNTRQAYASFALYLMSCRGIRTDKAKCTALIKGTKRELKRCLKICRREGLIKENGKKSLKDARARLVASLPKSTQERLDETVKRIKAYNASREKHARNDVQLEHGLTDKQLAKAQRKLDKLLLKDIDHKELLRRWPYSEELYRDMRSLARKPRPFNALGVSLTKTGLVSVKADACRLSGDPVLKAFATHTSANSLLKKSQRMLQGAYIPLQTTYESPIATGRISSRASDVPLVGDNFTNFRRSAFEAIDTGEELPGQRECIIPRSVEGHPDDCDCGDCFILCSIDLDAAEMRGYAQVEYLHFGDSELGRTLNAGMNPHRALAAEILHLSYAEFMRRYELEGDDETAPCHEAAQFAKIPNFALLGGGGWRMLPDYARGMQITITDAEAQELYEAFHARWKTVKAMHKYLKKYIHKRYEHPFSRRLRYIDRYAQSCNNPFQGLIADAAKWACCQLAREEYTSRGSLRGSYSVLFMHDEVIFELMKSMQSEHAWRANKIIIDSVNEYLPDVPMTAKPALMPYLAKGAKTVLHPKKKDRDGNPLLLVWEDKKAA